MAKKSKSKRRAVPKRVKASIRRMNHAQLAALLMFLQAFLRAQKMGTKRGHKKPRKGKTRKSSKGLTAGQRRFAALARKYHGRIPKGTKI
jgi:hypothetical protein